MCVVMAWTRRSFGMLLFLTVFTCGVAVNEKENMLTAILQTNEAKFAIPLCTGFMKSPLLSASY